MVEYPEGVNELEGIGMWRGVGGSFEVDGWGSMEGFERGEIGRDGKG